MTATIFPAELNRIRNRGVTVDLIDVRTPLEYRQARVEFSRNVPLDALDAGRLTSGRGGSDAPIYVICRSGSRGRQAADRLAAAGCAGVVNVDGGILRWAEAGFPLVSEKRKTVSLERQVRITCGGLIVVGSLLGWLVHPGFIALAGAVGGGLLFSGVTDTCAMASLIARMPWNEPAEGGASPRC